MGADLGLILGRAGARQVAPQGPTVGARPLARPAVQFLGLNFTRAAGSSLDSLRLLGAATRLMDRGEDCN